MNGLMQQRQLLISDLIEHACAHHGEREVVSHLVDGSVYRYTWHDVHARAKRVANAVGGLGVAPGERVSSLAWNTHRHLELYFGVTGSGAVLTTVNPRLFAEQISYIINHSESRYVFFDTSFSATVEEIAKACPNVQGFIAMCGRDQMPDIAIRGLRCYEELIEAADTKFDWPRFDENRASTLCYTSGTTGNPKGVLYSHRSTVLHSFGTCTADGFAIAARDSILLVVPMFHVNAWGVPYAAAMSGAKLVLPGPWLDGENIYRMLRNERCTITLGVPTVWLSLFDYVEKNVDDTRRREETQLTRVVVGGSAAPRIVIEKFERYFGAFVIQAWGMSETSPVATVCTLLAKHQSLTLDQRFDLQTLQGRAMYGVEIAVFDDDLRRIPHDGKTAGQLKVRGPWIASAYYKNEDDSAWGADGWFATGDVAMIDPDGYLRITDRSKDVIKSGGEWISSIDLENVALSHPAVQEAAVIGVAHSRWQERPLLVVVKKPGNNVTSEDIIEFMRGRIAKWWLPDDVVFVESLPHSATGKLQKVVLRQKFSGHRFSTDLSDLTSMSRP
ncbi:acyl-CoA synthetase (AMP-forming)/AMP-acid ligase II [Paraburkholderia sp. MM5496-R1]|uniref:long-chain-fatty-acid--CoA ligase n=1 Tax=Paraburkholderia sp. MM5496-R1 TaxID=2991065 RepID=UPI003D200CCC